MDDPLKETEKAFRAKMLEVQDLVGMVKADHDEMRDLLILARPIVEASTRAIARPSAIVPRQELLKRIDDIIGEAPGAPAPTPEPPRRVFRTYDLQIGNHHHVRIFAAKNADQTFANIGTITMDGVDYEEFCCAFQADHREEDLPPSSDD